MTTNLTRFDNDGLELFINTQTGECFASVRGIARMVGKTASSIHHWASVQKIETKEAQIQTQPGLRSVQLFDAKAVFRAAMKFKPELAEAMAEFGATAYLYGLAGYQIAPTTEKVDRQGQITKADLIPVIREAVGEIVREEAAKELASIHKSLDTLINGWLVEYQEGSNAFVKELEIARNTVVETCNKQLAMLEEDMQESIPLRWHKLR